MKKLLGLLFLFAFAFTTIGYASTESTIKSNDVEYIQSVHSDIVICETVSLSIENPVDSGVLNYEVSTSINSQKENLFINYHSEQAEMITIRSVNPCLLIYYTCNNVNLFQINKNINYSDNYNIDTISYNIELMNGNNYKTII